MHYVLPKVTSVDLSSNGTVLASGSGDYQMRICESLQRQSLSAAHLDVASVQGTTFCTDDSGVSLPFVSYEFASTKFGSRGAADLAGELGPRALLIRISASTRSRPWVLLDT